MSNVNLIVGDDGSNTLVGSDGADLIYGKENHVIVLLDPEVGQRGWVELAHDADGNIISVRGAGGTRGRDGKRVLAQPSELVPE